MFETWPKPGEYVTSNVSVLSLSDDYIDSDVLVKLSVDLRFENIN